jgi:DNA-binding NtrC family response regulator
MDVLSQYEWPGNVRELRTVLQRAMSLEPRATTLGLELLRVEEPSKQSGTRRLSPEWKTFKEAKDLLLDQWENQYLREVLGRANGNMTLAARYAGIARGHLYRLLKKHNLVRASLNAS